MKQIFPIVLIILIVFCAFLMGFFIVERAELIDPRSPPADVQPGRFSHQTTKTESWSNLPIVSLENGGTEAASIQRPTPKRLTTDYTENTEEIVDFGRRMGFPVPGENLERSDPPPSPYIGERIPFWYEHERDPGEPYEPPPTPARRGGLFRNLFGGRTP